LTDIGARLTFSENAETRGGGGGGGKFNVGPELVIDTPPADGRKGVRKVGRRGSRGAGANSRGRKRRRNRLCGESLVPSGDQLVELARVNAARSGDRGRGNPDTIPEGGYPVAALLLRVQRDVFGSAYSSHRLSIRIYPSAASLLADIAAVVVLNTI
jgi:hypothetical protein